MTAEVLSFEPVYVDGCTLAPTPSTARTMRFKQLGGAQGRQPVGTTVDVSCGNSLCYTAKHVVLRRWKSFGGKWQPLATKLAGLPVGGSFDLPDYPSDAASRSRPRCDDERRALPPFGQEVSHWPIQRTRHPHHLA